MSIKKESPSTGRNGAVGHYDKAFIEEVVNAVNEGLSPKIARARYGIAQGTLSCWMKNYGSVAYQQRRKLPVPAAVKRKILRSVEQGSMTVQEAKIAYNLKSHTSIYRWKKELKQENAELAASKPTLMDKKAPDNKPSGSTPAEVKALQQALRDAELKIAALNMLIDVAEEQLKINIRKKPGAKQ
jgi:transposase-like protein